MGRSLLDRVLWREAEQQAEVVNGELMRGGDPLALQQWVDYFQFSGIQYPFLINSTLAEPIERPDPSFAGYVQGALKSNGVIFACIAARMLVFSEARFQFRRLQSGRPGKYFGNQNLKILEKPWQNGTTGDLLRRAITDVDLSGNFFCRRDRNVLQRLRPDWMTIVLGSKELPDKAGHAPDATVLGYTYWPGGIGVGEPIDYAVEEIAHWAPFPDPVAHWRGMSWVTPILTELTGDNAAMRHKLKFFENGAVPGILIGLDPAVTMDAFLQWQEKFQSEHEGLDQAYKTLFLGGGAKASVVGSSMEQMTFADVQGHGEVRICAAARIPPIIVGLSKGLEASTYSNYGQARRAFADLTMRPLWRDFAGSIARLITVPGGAELWYDDRDIPFLREDVKEAAEALQLQATALKTLVDAGYDPDSARDAVVAGDLTLLGAHTGLVSVQLRPAGEAAPTLPGAKPQAQLPPGKSASAVRSNGNGAHDTYAAPYYCPNCDEHGEADIPLGVVARHAIRQQFCPTCGCQALEVRVPEALGV